MMDLRERASTYSYSTNLICERYRCWWLANSTSGEFIRIVQKVLSPGKIHFAFYQRAIKPSIKRGGHR